MSRDKTTGVDVVSVSVGKPALGGVKAVPLSAGPNAPTKARVVHLSGTYEVTLREDGSVTIDFPSMTRGEVITVTAI